MTAADALGTAEPLLVAVVGLLVLVIIGLVAMALVLRKRGQAAPVAEPAAGTPRPRAQQPAPPSPPARPRVRVRSGGGSGGGLAMAMSATSSSGAMVCPTCRTEHKGMTYCTRDARRLVPPEDMLGHAIRTPGRSAGLVCMACRRAYEPGLRSCPHDGNELVPSQVYNATRPRRPRTSEPAGVIARICPVCGNKYDLNARFCGHDAGELVVIN
nr:hypothetical protein [Kofleriaceae bacterium]